MHTELISFAATAPGAAGAAAVALSGDSLTIKNSRGEAQILAWWADHQADGFQQLVFPSGHDTTRGFRSRVEVGEVSNLMTLGIPIDVQPQEQMTVTMSGSAVAGDVESGCFLVNYRDLPGMSQRSITWDQLRSRTEKLTTLDGTINTTPGPSYSGSQAINAGSDLLLANRDYAIMGSRVTTQCLTLNVRGPDTGNVRVGMPGDVLHPEITSNWFCLLSRAYDEPLIPIFNSGNKTSTLLDCAQDENAAAVPFTLFLALLKK